MDGHLRLIVHGRPVAAAASRIALAMLLWPAVALGADDASDAPYAVRAEHTVLSEEPAGRQGRRLELRLRLSNEDVRDLFDLRVRLLGLGDARPPLSCSPVAARLRLLPSGTGQELTSSFVCADGYRSGADSLRDLTFEIEAVDVSTQEIVTFVLPSREGD